MHNALAQPAHRPLCLPRPRGEASIHHAGTGSPSPTPDKCLPLDPTWPSQLSHGGGDHVPPKASPTWCSRSQLLRGGRFLGVQGSAALSQTLPYPSKLKDAPRRSPVFHSNTAVLSMNRGTAASASLTNVRDADSPTPPRTHKTHPTLQGWGQLCAAASSYPHWRTDCSTSRNPTS